MKLHNRLPLVRLPLWASLLSAVLLSGGITLLALWCQPNALRAVMQVFLSQPLLIVLNALPIGLLVLCFAFLFRNVFFGASLVNFGVCALSIANRIKIEVRDEPVFPRDFGLLKEASSAMGTFDIHFPVKVILVVAAVSLLLLVMGVLMGSRPVSFPALRQKLKLDALSARVRSLLSRLLGLLSSFALLVVLILTVYASDGLYGSFAVSNPYHVPEVFNELGFPYAFCHHFTTYLVDKPEGYSKAEAERWETGDQIGLGKDVNVIMVMNEAFSDLSDDPVFAFSPEEDPMPHLHALQQDPHAISGHLVVPGFAGGTANTEFDVLTGMQTNALSATTTSSFRVVNRNLDSLFRVFGADGYRTSFFHPGHNWFYNRENVYQWLGAEQMRFAEDMVHAEYKGGWITDHYAAQLIEEEFEAAQEEGRPLFHYTTSIQNHMSFTYDKYGEGYQFPEVPLTVPVSDETRMLLEVYLEGIRDADAMLGQLTDYFSQTEEPVVLAFWGDHLPYLGDNLLGYSELGSPVALPASEREDPMVSYETPFVIWANDAAAETLDWDAATDSLDLPENGRLSASFLGAAMLELTGRQDSSPWFSFLNEIRRETPVVQKLQQTVYMFPDGSYSSEISPEFQAQIEKWRCWTYYKLTSKHIDG